MKLEAIYKFPEGNFGQENLSTNFCIKHSNLLLEIKLYNINSSQFFFEI